MKKMQNSISFLLSTLVISVSFFANSFAMQVIREEEERVRNQQLEEAKKKHLLQKTITLKGKHDAFITVLLPLIEKIPLLNEQVASWKSDNNFIRDKIIINVPYDQDVIQKFLEIFSLEALKREDDVTKALKINNKIHNVPIENLVRLYSIGIYFGFSLDSIFALKLKQAIIEKSYNLTEEEKKILSENASEGNLIIEQELNELLYNPPKLINIDIPIIFTTSGVGKRIRVPKQVIMLSEYLLNQIDIYKQFFSKEEDAKELVIDVSQINRPNFSQDTIETGIIILERLYKYATASKDPFLEFNIKDLQLDNKEIFMLVDIINFLQFLMITPPLWFSSEMSNKMMEMFEYVKGAYLAKNIILKLSQVVGEQKKIEIETVRQLLDSNILKEMSNLNYYKDSYGIYFVAEYDKIKDELFKPFPEYEPSFSFTDYFYNKYNEVRSFIADYNIQRFFGSVAAMIGIAAMYKYLSNKMSFGR